MLKEKLIKILKENGFLELELKDDKVLYINQRAGKYEAELDIWDDDMDDWKLLHSFKPVSDAEELVNSLMYLFEI